jgi:hypothetical protein
MAWRLNVMRQETRILGIPGDGDQRFLTSYALYRARKVVGSLSLSLSLQAQCRIWAELHERLFAA